MVCSEREADVLFRPCMHMIACESELYRKSCSSMYDFLLLIRLFSSNEEVCDMQSSDRSVYSTNCVSWWKT